MRTRMLILFAVLFLLLGACARETTTTPKGGESPADSPSPEESPMAKGDDLVAAASDLEGNWSGTWKNLTFGSSGSATAKVTIDKTAKTITMEVDLGGSVFGEDDPPAQSFTESLAGGTKFEGQVATLGGFTAMVSPDAKTFTFGAPNVPSSRVNVVKGSGKLEGGKITVDADITLSDGSTAKAVIELTKS